METCKREACGGGEHDGNDASGGGGEDNGDGDGGPGGDAGPGGDGGPGGNVVDGNGGDGAGSAGKLFGGLFLDEDIGEDRDEEETVTTPTDPRPVPIVRKAKKGSTCHLSRPVLTNMSLPSPGQIPFPCRVPCLSTTESSSWMQRLISCQPVKGFAPQAWGQSPHACPSAL